MIVLAMHPHDKFKRKENDLKLDMKVSLVEALDTDRVCWFHLQVIKNVEKAN